MAGYPYYSPPPPSPPCNDTTPTLPPPPPPPACNHTTTPTLPRPPPTACACNKTSPTLPPPASPPPHSSYYSPPLASMSSPPPPPSTRYSPPSHSPPPSSHPPPASPPPPPPFYYSPPLLPPSSSDYSPPPPSQSPPKPSKASPPPLLQPTKPPPAPSPYYSPQTPLHPPLAPNPPLCHCVCPSPWATPPSYYPSIAPSPQFLSPSNGNRTVVLTTFVSLGGVFFLAFITIGLLSMAIRKRMPSMPTMGQPDNSHGRAQTVQSIPESTSAAHSVIDIGPNKITVPPDQGVGHIVKEGEIPQQTMSTAPLSNQSVPNKISADLDVEQPTFEEVKDDPNKRLPKEQELGDDQEKLNDSNKRLGKPLADQNVPDNMDTPPDAEQEPDDDEEKSDERNRKPPDDQGETGNTTQDVNQESNAAEDESNYSKKKIPKRSSKKNRSDGHKGQKGEKKSFKLGQPMKDAIKLYADGEQESEGDDNGEEEEVHDSPQDEKHESNADEKKSDERDHKPFGDPSVTDNADIDQESSAVEAKSNDSRNKLHPHMKNPFSGRKGKKGGKNFFKVDQAMKAAIGQYGESESQDDDNDEGEVLQDRDALQDVDHESNANEEESDERNRMPLIEQTETDNLDAAQDVEQGLSAIAEESNDSQERLPPNKKNLSSGHKGNQGERKPSKVVQPVTSILGVNLDGEMQPQDEDDDDNNGEYNATQDAELESNANEDPDELNRKPLGSQSETDNSTQDAGQESNAVEDESKKSLRSLKKYPSNSRKSKQTKPSKLPSQAMKAAFTFNPDGDQESQVDDDDEELQDPPQDAEYESNADEETNERNRNPPKKQTEIDNIDAAQDVEQVSYAVEEESNDSKAQLRTRKKTYNARKGEQGEKQFPKLGQAGKAVINFYPDAGEQEYQDDESDEAEAQEVSQVAEDQSNAYEGTSDERDRKPFGDRSVTDVTDIAQDVDQESSAVEKESTNSNERLRPHKKSPSSGLKGKQGERKSSKLGQFVKAAVNVDLDGAVHPQDYDNDEAEEEQSYRGRKELSNLGQILTVTSDDNSGKDLESFGNPDDKEEESEAYSSNQDLRRHKRHTSTQGRKVSSNLSKKFSATIGADPGVSLADDDEKATKPELYGSDEDSPRNIFIGAKNLNQIVTETFGHDPSMECKSLISDGDKEESESFGSNKDSRLHTRQISVRRRKEPLNEGQILTASISGDPGMYLKFHADDDENEENDDLVNECDDPSMEGESFVNDNAKKAESKSFGSKKVSHLQKSQTGAQRRKEAPDVGQTSTTQIGGDVGVDLKSLADDYEKEENEDPSIECDDPNMEYYELLVDDDAKEEKSNSFGSKKVSRLHKRQIGAPGRRDPRNVGHIWSDPLGGDPSTYFKSFADDDEKEEKEDQGMECDDPSMELEPFVDDGAKEESEPFGLKKVTSLQKRQIGGRGRKGPPNVGQFLNIPTGGDAGVDLKFLAVEQKKLELFGRKEVSRLHKRQTGASGRKEPPNVGQILTATTGSDPRVGLKSVGTQVWVSNIGESMTVRNDDDPYGELQSHDDDGEGDLSVTATNEGDPNAGLEFHEEDEELESECSNKGLALQKLHSLSLGETEPSTDDQSVFVTRDDDPDESGKVARSGNPLSRPRTTGVRGKIT